MNSFNQTHESYFLRANSILSRIESQLEKTDNPDKIKFLLFRLKKVDEILRKKQEIELEA